MFVDKVRVILKAGDGGNGIVSFRHEKFIDRGGPDGGDGGKGGDVILEASFNQNTLANFRYQKELKAKPGETGLMRKKHGKNGQDLIALVPVGTVVINENGETLADFVHENQRVVIAKGGRGGFGNAHFTSSTRQAPRVAELGEPGEELKATLELKMIADVGIVGLPNAGKSTLLAAVSNAQPEIANYPFTTLTPNLGVVDVDPKTSLLFADIPGLIAGASRGKGLGDEFLRHVERTAVLLHLIDIYNDDVSGAYQTIQDELKAYQVDLTKRPQVVALTKIEGVDKDQIEDKLAELKRILPKNAPLLTFSSLKGEGLKPLLFELKKVVEKQRSKSAQKLTKTKTLPVLRLSDDHSWRVVKKDNKFIISGSRIEKFALRTDFSNPHSEERLRDIMQKTGISRELNRQGVQLGQMIQFGDNSDLKLEY